MANFRSILGLLVGLLFVSSSEVSAWPQKWVRPGFPFTFFHHDEYDWSALKMGTRFQFVPLLNDPDRGALFPIRDPQTNQYVPRIALGLEKLSEMPAERTRAVELKLEELARLAPFQGAKIIGYIGSYRIEGDASLFHEAGLHIERVSGVTLESLLSDEPSEEFVAQTENALRLVEAMIDAKWIPLDLNYASFTLDTSKVLRPLGIVLIKGDQYREAGFSDWAQFETQLRNSYAFLSGIEKKGILSLNSRCQAVTGKLDAIVPASFRKSTE